VTEILIHRLGDKPEWLDKVAEWHHDVWLQEQRTRASDLDAESIAQSLEKRKALLRSHLEDEPLPESFLAEYQGRVVASASIVYYQFLSDQARSEWLTNVYVEPSCRRNGIAAFLIDYVCAYAAEQGISELKLYTSERAEYYRKLGGKTRGSGQVLGREVDILCRACASA